MIYPVKNILSVIFLFITANVFSQNSQCDQLVNEGFNYLKQGNLSVAIDKYNEALEFDANKLEAHYGLGVAYSATCLQNGGYCEKAIEHFLQADEIKSGFREVYYNLGVCYIKRLNYEKALFYLDKAIEQRSNDGEYYYNRGFANVQLGRKNAGCEDFQEALNLKFMPAKDSFNEYCRN